MDYTQLATDDTITKTIASLKERNIQAEVVGTKEEALERIKSLIPAGASVNNGSSVTLHEIGFIDYLKSGAHGWNNLHAAVIAEQDIVKKEELRKLSSFSDYYLGSVHALSENGDIVIASNSASQLPSVVSTAKNLIFVVGTQKITPTLDGALARLREYVVPLEDARMKSTGASGTQLSKILIFEKEPTFTKRVVHLIFIKEKLGY